MSPSSISSSRSMQRSSVDLPEPEAPISATASCSATSKSPPWRTSRSPKALVTPLTSITGAPPLSAPHAVDDAGERDRDQQVEHRGGDDRGVVEVFALEDLGDAEGLLRADDRDQRDVLLQGDEVVQQRWGDPADRLRQDHVAHRLRLGEAD